jgi:tRNA threonylcarbamoyladenosine modification (KEOPS) complex  Pcc1 subunit
MLASFLTGQDAVLQFMEGRSRQEHTMNATAKSEEQDTAREILESLIAEAPEVCACGRTMTVVSRGARVSVECESLRDKSGLRLAIASGLHDWRAVELPATLSAAA